MPAVFIQQPLAPEELKQLKEEFPNYDYLIRPPEDWADIEVLFGHQISNKELTDAHRLRWIHVPSADLQNLPLKQIAETTNLLISNTKDSDAHCFAEYAIGMILASAKHLWEWTSAQTETKNSYKEMIWSLKGKTLVQVGLGAVGSSIVEKAEQFGMRTWGISENASFHDHCTKTFCLSNLHSLLPATDVLSIAIPRGETTPLILDEETLKLMKNDSVILIIGSEDAFDEQALAKAAGDFRAIIIDGSPDSASPLWAAPILITPQIASLPSAGHRLEFLQFQYNFRRYARNEFDGMKNLIKDGM